MTRSPRPDLPNASREANVPISGSNLPTSGGRLPIPNGWPRGSGYSHAVVAEGRQMYIAGQIGWDPITRQVASGIVAQTRQALENIVAVLRAGSARPEHLVRLTWFITDRDAYVREQRAIGAAYRDVIGRHFPAMSVIVVPALIEPGAEVEIEATAVVPDESTNSAGA